MSLKVRFYLAPQKGTGTFIDPYRSILNDLIDTTLGDWFDEIDNPVRRLSLCCVHASDDVHTGIEKDSRVIPVSPLYKDEADLKDGMNGIYDLKSIDLKALGIDKDMVSGTTLKDILSYIIKVFTVAQVADGKGDQITKTLIASDPMAISGGKTIGEAIDLKVKQLGMTKLRMSGEDF